MKDTANKTIGNAGKSISALKQARIRLFLSSSLLLISTILFCLIFVLSCAQDSIFYNLSMEPEPIEPRINGSPTNIALASDRIYVGTRMGKAIHIYSGSGWSAMGTPGGGSLGDLAGDGTDLYALVYPGGDPLRSSVIRKYDGVNRKWTNDSFNTSGYSIQTIFCAEDKLFAGAMINYLNYAILCFDGVSMEVVATGTSLLKGASKCGTDYYLATLDNGIYKYSGSSAIPVGGTTGNITGIITTGDAVVAVSSGGNVYYLETGDIAFKLLVSPGVAFTGAMCTWNTYDRSTATETPALLLLGMRGSGTSLTHGYRELRLNADGTPTSTLKPPGEESLPTSARSKKAKYDASIGIHPVESIIQVPSTMISSPASEFALPVFASTSRNGLWSCRNGEWNAEP